MPAGRARKGYDSRTQKRAAVACHRNGCPNHVPAERNSAAMADYQSTPDRLCLVCGRPLSSECRSLAKYCSRVCGWKARTPEQQRATQNAWRERSRARSRTQLLAERPCAKCGRAFRPRQRSTAQYCSHLCSATAWQQRKYASDRERKLRERACAICKRRFIPERRATTRTCSNRCAKRLWNSRHPEKISQYVQDRRARVADAPESEPIDRRIVFTRDRWRCQLCGRSTPESLAGTQSRQSPTLDHITPLSCGGSHTYANVQTACSSCNSKKRTKIKGQFRLF